MKTLLVLLWTLVAAAYCEFSEIVFYDNCIAIKNTRPYSRMNDYDGFLNSDTGSWESAEICCDLPFDTTTEIRAFTKFIKRSDIKWLLDSNYLMLTEGKTNCKKGQSGAAL